MTTLAFISSAEIDEPGPSFLRSSRCRPRVKVCPVAGEFLRKIIYGVGDLAGAFVFRRPDLCLTHDIDRAGTPVAELLKGWLYLDGPSTTASRHAGSGGLFSKCSLML